MTPTTETELSETIRMADGALHITGGGTRRIGAPVKGAPLCTSGLSGITHYEPGALTLVAQTGTTMAEIESALNAENQRLAFEPMDHRALLGTQGTPTIGGVVAANISGSRRISAGACRDHLLGVRYVDGRGVVVKNGGRVMKNVTGYDLVKLLAGSYGTLGVLSEVSLKVLPNPETSLTLCLPDQSIADSVTAMSVALGSAFEVTGAAMLSGNTYLRIEGFEASVNYRAEKLRAILAVFDNITQLDYTETLALWDNITNVGVFCDHHMVTRVSVQPSMAPKVAALMGNAADIAMDWGGGLMWFGMRGDDSENAVLHQKLQDFAQTHGGHATLIKASEDQRRVLRVFQPENPTVATLSAELRAKFDPRGILNSGLMA